MESLRRPFLRKKLSNASSNSFSDKHVYDSGFVDGVSRFGGPTYSARIDDYGEIFGASRVSSIPILDVSALDEAKVSAEAPSSKLDYSKIFGGFGDCDLGVSYEEMFAKPKRAKNFSVGARTPAEAVSYSEGSDQLNHFREEAFQNESPNQSFEGVKQFNMSYHKTSPKGNNGKLGTTRITQLPTVPGFTCFVDDNPPLQKAEEDKSRPPPKVDVTSPPKGYVNAAKKHSDGTGKFENHCSGNTFYSLGKSFSAKEPKTNSSKMSSPSSVPANLFSNKSMPKKSMGSNSKVPQNNASNAGPGYCSPSFSDEELDVNSEAAASAAALRKALETAQASIRIAKQFMERKDGTQRFSKSSSKDDVGINDRSEDKVSVEDIRVREKSAKEMSERGDIVFQVFSKSEMEKAQTRRSGKGATDLNETKEISVVKEVVQERRGNQWETAEAGGALRQSSGMENRVEYRNVALPCDHARSKKNILEFVDTHECGMKDMETDKEILEQPDWCGKKVDEEARKLEDLVVKLNILKETRDLKQHVDRLDSSQEVQEQEENEKARVSQVDEETKGKQKASNSQENFEKELEEFLELKENEEFLFQGGRVNNNEGQGLNESQECMETEKKLEDTFGQEQNEKLLEEFFDLQENEEFESQGVMENNEGYAEVLECLENERKLEVTTERKNENLLQFLDLKENELESLGVKVNNDEVGFFEAQECMENDRKLEDILREEQNKKLEEFFDLKENEEFDSQRVKANNSEEGLDEAQECVENERKLEDHFVMARNEKLVDFYEKESGNSPRKIFQLNEVDEGLEAPVLCAGYVEVFEVDSMEKKHRDAHDGDNNEKNFGKIDELDFSNKRFNDILDGEESQEKGEDNTDCAKNENMLLDECEEADNIQGETEGNEMTKVNQESVEETTNLDATINACEWEEGESVTESEEVYKRKQNDHDMYFEENKRSDEMGHETGEKESCNSGGLVRGATDHIEMENKMSNGFEALFFNHNPANIVITDTSFGPKQTDLNEKNSELSSTVGSRIKVSVCDSSVEAEREAHKNVVFDPEEVDGNFETAVHVRRVRKQWFETGMKMEPSQPSSVFEGEEKTKRTDGEVKTNQIIDEVIKSNIDTAHERRVRKQWFDPGKKMEPSQLPSRYKEEEKTLTIDEEIEMKRFTEKNVDNLAKTFAVEEKETKEKEVKKDYLRKIDEAYKRERERDNDRMAVERAIREARERAFAEARERAERAAVERATAESRKRVMAEAREKLEKASAATKLSSEKASKEAKLRAERAAVERATVEARERALEKALSQKATSGPREHTERYNTENISGVSRENGTKQNFSSSDTQKLNESNGESAERRKARLERNQRTMERAAKALAEKNKRDILAQKEQAERNRYAETLDAEVKRWSTGKEGNLRALLSTLQYILGTNSGWQPVPLTEIVTTAAVKKAYRKATLHVHPDKLQQRGATIQHKYICEKVFDLLKAAWNRFNSEER